MSDTHTVYASYISRGTASSIAPLSVGEPETVKPDRKPCEHYRIGVQP